jgi:hypothetical protein
VVPSLLSTLPPQQCHNSPPTPCDKLEFYEVMWIHDQFWRPKSLWVEGAQQTSYLLAQHKPTYGNDLSLCQETKSCECQLVESDMDIYWCHKYKLGKFLLRSCWNLCKLITLPLLTLSNDSTTWGEFLYGAHWHKENSPHQATCGGRRLMSVSCAFQLEVVVIPVLQMMKWRLQLLVFHLLCIWNSHVNHV